MDAKSIAIKRTGMSSDDADIYVAMAEARIRDYLDLPDDADMSAYTFATADIAVLYWQMDQSAQHASSFLGFESQSFSEGGVSRSQTAMTGADIRSTYEAAIVDVLAGLSGSRGKVVFL